MFASFVRSSLVRTSLALALSAGTIATVTTPTFAQQVGQQTGQQPAKQQAGAAGPHHGDGLGSVHRNPGAAGAQRRNSIS